jgi:hypothetical protein
MGDDPGAAPILDAAIVCADQFNEANLITRRWRNVEFDQGKQGAEHYEQ